MADLDLSIEDGVATLTMNRPQARNALSMDMRAQMYEAFHQVEFDDALRCVVWTISWLVATSRICMSTCRRTRRLRWNRTFCTAFITYTP